MAEKKKGIERRNWRSSFSLIGEVAKFNDFTFKIDEVSDKSNWKYSKINLGVFCGEKYGTVYAEMMGGFGVERENKLYVHGRKEDGTDDFKDRMIIDWEDRFDEDIIETLGRRNFVNIGIKKDTNDKIVWENFLSEYDAIAYLKENLEEGTKVSVSGNIEYGSYDDNTTVRKEIRKIVLVNEDTPSKAVFQQSILLNKESIVGEDKEQGVVLVDARVLNYVNKFNNIEVKGFVPFTKRFEYEIDFDEKTDEQVAAIKKLLFGVRKDVTQVTFNGKLIESGSMVKPSVEDIPEEFKAMIELGMITEEEALEKCATNDGKKKRMVLTIPEVQAGNEEEGKSLKILKEEGAYKEEDLILNFLNEEEREEAEVDQASTKVSDEAFAKMLEDL